jgi:hypothetical protein
VRPYAGDGEVSLGACGIQLDVAIESLEAQQSSPTSFSTRAGLGVERSEDPRRERGRTAAVDEVENRVQIDAAVSRESGGLLGNEPGGEEAAASPPDHGAKLCARVV